MDSIFGKYNEALTKSISDNGPYADFMKHFDSSSAASKMANSITAGSTYADFMKHADSSSAASKLANSIIAGSAYADFMKHVDGSGAASKLANSIMAGSTYADFMKHVDSSSAISKLANSIIAGSTYADFMKHADSSGAASKLVNSIMAGSTYDDLLKRIDNSSSIAKLASSIGASGTYADFLKHVDSSSSISKFAKSITDNTSFYASLERLSQYEYLDKLFDEVEIKSSAKNLNIDDATADSEVQDALNLLQELASTENSSGFAKILEKAPGWLKWLLVGFIVSVIWPLLIGAASGVMGNLITPYVQEYLDATQSTTQREQIKGLKKLPFSELGIELRGYRFITATTLHIRATPNARAPIVGELKFGQVVSVLSSNLNWTEVLYEYGDGSTVVGWVFTRYTAKFRS